MFTAAVLLAAACGAQPARAADSATFQLTTTPLYPAAVPARFLGFSIEVKEAPLVFLEGGLGGQPRAAFATLMNTLRNASNEVRGPVIRIGGNSADESVYLPSPAPLPVNATYRITDADFDAYQAVRAWNGTVVIDTNLRYADAKRGGDASLPYAHVAAAAKALGWDDLIESVEVGNEPDLFFKNGIRDTSYTFADYLNDYGTVARALSPLIPTSSPKILGATWTSSWSYSVDDFTNYLRVYKGNFSSISFHRYPLDVCDGKKTSIEKLLADKSAAGVANQTSSFPPLCAPLPLFIGEGNNVACGGAYGISDVWASALWAIDVLFNVAAVGVARYNLHGMPGGAYSAISWVDAADPSDTAPIVHPTYYGMLAFAQMTANSSTILNVTTVANTNSFIKLWSVVDANLAQRVVAIHKDLNATEAATITLLPASRLVGAAILTRGLPGTRGFFSNATDGISIGGLSWSSTVDGTPSGTPTSESITVSADGSYSFSLPPASFAIITLPRA